MGVKDLSYSTLFNIAHYWNRSAKDSCVKGGSEYEGNSITSCFDQSLAIQDELVDWIVTSAISTIKYNNYSK